MVSWGVTFLIIALISGVMGFSGAMSSAATDIAWIMFVVGLVLALVMIFGAPRRGGYY